MKIFPLLLLSGAITILSPPSFAQTEPSIPSSGEAATGGETGSVNSANPASAADPVPLVIPSSARDTRLNEGLKFCAGLSNGSERVSCYDRVVEAAGIKVWKDDESTKSNWTYHEDVNSNDYEAFTTVRNQNGEVKSQLFLRCHQGQMELYEKWTIPVGSRSIKISIGPDQKNKVSYLFKPSISGSSMGLWQSHDAIALAKYLVLVHSGPIFFEAHFVDGDDLSVFHLDGIEKAVLGVRRSCNW